MQDGKIDIIDPHTKKLEGTIKVHLRRDYPQPIIELLVDCLSNGFAKWQDRVIEIDLKK